MASLLGARHAGLSPAALRAALPPPRSGLLRAAPWRPRAARCRTRAAFAEPGGVLPLLRERAEPPVLLERLFLSGEEEEEERERERISAGTIHGWMEKSIPEIVRKLGEAPLLVQLFSGGGIGGFTLQREAAEPGSWARTKKRWGRGRGPPPDGMILVQELGGGGDEEVEGGARKVWGLVVQGLRMEHSACYLLYTCRVQSPAGFCTHFSLARAQCFGDAVELQLRNAWLQGLPSSS